MICPKCRSIRVSMSEWHKDQTAYASCRECWHHFTVRVEPREMPPLTPPTPSAPPAPPTPSARDRYVEALERFSGAWRSGRLDYPEMVKLDWAVQDAYSALHDQQRDARPPASPAPPEQENPNG